MQDTSGFFGFGLAGGDTLRESGKGCALPRPCWSCSPAAAPAHRVCSKRGGFGSVGLCPGKGRARTGDQRSLGMWMLLITGYGCSLRLFKPPRNFFFTPQCPNFRCAVSCSQSNLRAGKAIGGDEAETTSVIPGWLHLQGILLPLELLQLPAAVGGGRFSLPDLKFVNQFSTLFFSELGSCLNPSLSKARTWGWCCSKQSLCLQHPAESRRRGRSCGEGSPNPCPVPWLWQRGLLRPRRSHFAGFEPATRPCGF